MLTRPYVQMGEFVKPSSRSSMLGMQHNNIKTKQLDERVSEDPEQELSNSRHRLPVYLLRPIERPVIK